MKDPKDTMRALLESLKTAEAALGSALDRFAEFPGGKSRNGSKRMDQLIDALHLLQSFQFDLPRDWEKSHWFREEEHQEFLRTLEEELRSSDLAPTA
jgi:hypothetical protein